jgi:hypothetical protein
MAGALFVLSVSLAVEYKLSLKSHQTLLKDIIIETI